MTEENKQTESVDHQEQVDTTEEPTVKVAEMKRRLNQEKEKYEQQLADLKDSQEDKIQQALENFKKEQEMTANELAEYKQKQAEQRHQQQLDELNEKIAAYQQKEKQAEIKDEAIKKLDELNIESNEKTLSLIMADTLDGMAARADVLAEYTNALKNKYSTSTEPGGSQSNHQRHNQLPFSTFDEARIL